MICSQCGEFKQLYRNGICATCNKVNRERGKPSKPKKVYALRHFSKKKEKANREKLKAYRKLGETNVCQTCGRSDLPISRSHLIPVGQYPQFEANTKNILLECYGQSDACHDVWEHGSWLQKQQLKNFKQRMETVKQLCPEYYNRLLLKWKI